MHVKVTCIIFWKLISGNWQVWSMSCDTSADYSSCWEDGDSVQKVGGFWKSTTHSTCLIRFFGPKDVIIYIFSSSATLFFIFPIHDRLENAYSQLPVSRATQSVKSSAQVKCSSASVRASRSLTSPGEVIDPKVIGPQGHRSQGLRDLWGSHPSFCSLMNIN